MRLTDALLTKQNLRAADYNDDSVAGLAIRVGKKRRTWTLRYRDASGKYAREPLGYYAPGSPTHVGIAAARQKARDMLDRVALGVPVTAPPVTKPFETMTLRMLCDAYETARLREGHRTKTFRYTMQCIRAGLGDWLDLSARNFTRQDLRAARDAMNDRGLTWGNRILAYTSGMLSWGVEEDLIDVNHARDLRRAPERKRDHVLSLDELARIWTACDQLGKGKTRGSYGRLVKFLILTGQRLNEGARLKHGDLIDQKVWNQRENKSNRPHRLPLSRQALDLIETGTARELVFPSSTGAKLTDFGNRKQELDEVSGVSGWILHDIRRSFASHLQELDISPLTIELLLNHALPGTMMAYLRSKLERQKAEALQLWADRLEGVIKARARALS